MQGSKTFKEFLKEELNLEQWVKAAMDHPDRDEYSIRGTEVIVHGTLHINDADLVDGSLPFKLKRVNYIFMGDAESFNSFKNFPSFLGKSKFSDAIAFGLDDYPLVHSLEGISEQLLGYVYLTNCPNIDYTKCNRYLKELNGTLIISPEYKGPILSTLLVKDLIDLVIPNMPPKSGYISKLNKILHTHFTGEKDIMDCQEELIQQGYKEYAKL